jgi:hypothetical protein
MMKNTKYLLLLYVLACSVAIAGPTRVIVKNKVDNPVLTEITNAEPIAVEVVGGNTNGQNGGNLGPKKASDLVTLMGLDDSCDGVGLRRVFPDATVEESWRPPAGSVLVGTGFDWRGRNGTPGELVEISLRVFDTSVGRLEAVFLDYARVGDNGDVGNSTPVQNAVWGPGILVCVRMSGADFEDARLRGFLAPDE